MNENVNKGDGHMETTDVVIIGGGVIGTSIAFRLAKLFKKIVVIEKGEVGGQTSASCDKAIFLQSKRPGFPSKLAKASSNMYRNLEEELDMSVEYKQSGGMIVIESESHLPFMESFIKSQRMAGMDVKLLDKEETLRQQPCFSSHVFGSTYCKDDAEVNPLLLSQAFADAAIRDGVDIRTHTEVIRIKVRKGKVTCVETNKGKIATNLVINAAGPFASSIAKMVNVDLPIKPRRGVILITEKVGPIINGSILCSQYLAAKHLTPEEKLSPFGIGLSLGQTESGNLLIGGSREFVGFNKKVSTEVFSEIARHACRIAPVLGNLRIIRTMVGFRPFTGDGLPIIDEAPGVQGLIIAAGHEGDGIALAPITGKLVADLVQGKKNNLLDGLKLERFALGS
ncbi:NAD(P)/FAD-dependent oxidoreductase [Pseudogracilibacillus sp. SO30301A]|uniref:NAD(P)/FAD-dependent oxidoreductase n=1 Tax=Pseudogracilibacillus sp. SO30301A TaxID=3098291 RepID=UPI00300E5B44